MKFFLVNITFFLGLFFCSHSINAQEKKQTRTPTEIFNIARELAFNGKRKQAQDTLVVLLKKNPDYHEIRTFLGSTYTWDGNYVKAKSEFLYVLSKTKKRKSTWLSIIKNELYAGKPFSALKLANDALEYLPEDIEILYLKASAEENSETLEKSLLTVNQILRINPAHKKGIQYKQYLINKLSYNTIGLDASIDVYSDIFDPVQYYTLSYSRQTKFGSATAKINFNRRFQTNGFQYEIDLYPSITRGLYAYLNIGFSNSSILPKIRYSAELFKSLPLGLEASLGYRGLRFSSATNIYTGSIGWYSGNDFWLFRTYITPNNVGFSKSGTLNYRKYRNNANNYFSISAGIGFSPEENRFDFGSRSIIHLKSQKFNIGYYFSSPNTMNFWGINNNIVRQEKSFDPGNYLWIFSVTISWSQKFK